MSSVILSQIRAGVDGSLLELWHQPDTGDSGPGPLLGRMRRIGDPSWTPLSPIDSSGNPLRSDGSGFGLDAAREGPERWLLVFVPDGETSPSDWWSADLGATWTSF